jgi:hypothetical protein
MIIKIKNNIIDLETVGNVIMSQDKLYPIDDNITYVIELFHRNNNTRITILRCDTEQDAKNALDLILEKMKESRKIEALALSAIYK